MVEWVIGLIPYGGSIELFLVPASAVRLVYQRLVCTICGIVHIKYPLQLTGKSSPWSGGSRFLLLLYEWSFSICLMPYHR